MHEDWRLVLGGFYQVSSIGGIRRARRGTGTSPGKILRTHVNRHTGYVSVTISLGGQTKTLSVHRLVSEAFIGPPNGLWVNHIDGDKTNNCLSNLEYCTPSENNRHALMLGLRKPKARNTPVPKSPRKPQYGDHHWSKKNPELIAFGDRSGKNKVSSAQVAEMREYHSHGWKQCDLALKYGLSRTQICRIIRGKRWAK